MTDIKKRGSVFVCAACACACACVLLLAVFASCATAKVRDADKADADPNFIGDFDPIRLEDAMALRTVMGKIKPTVLRLYFVPRTNIVEAHFRDGINAFVLMFDEDARNTIGEAGALYAASYGDYSSGNAGAMPVRKPIKQNAFNTGNVSVAWGVTSAARNGETSFRTNYEFLEKNKPYFLLTVEAAVDKEDSSTQSPPVNLYFSPSQLEALFEITGKDALREQVDELNKKAFTF